MTRKPYLYQVGNVTYGIVARNQWIAASYMTNVMRIPSSKRRSLGLDKRTHRQQYESSTIGVSVPSSWQEPHTYMDD